MVERAIYTHGHASAVLRGHRWRTAENSAAYLLPHLTAGQRLLDIGCGPATLTLDLAERVAPGEVTALEVSEQVLDLARAEVAERGRPLSFAVGDVQALDLPGDRFDVVHAHQVLQHLSDPVQALREMSRVCRPGGLVAVRDADYAAFAWWPMLPELDEWLALYRRAARDNGAEPDAGRRLLSWAQAAGLTDVTVSGSAWCFATPADRAWWGGMWADRIVASDLTEQLLRTGLADQQQLQLIRDAWLRWADAPDGWLLVPHTELLCRVH